MNLPVGAFVIEYELAAVCRCFEFQSIVSEGQPLRFMGPIMDYTPSKQQCIDARYNVIRTTMNNLQSNAITM